MSVGQQCFRNVELKGGLITHLYFQTIFIFRLTPKPRKKPASPYKISYNTRQFVCDFFEIESHNESMCGMF